MNGMFERAQLQLITEINHDHGILIVINRNEFLLGFWVFYSLNASLNGAVRRLRRPI